ncbi:MAG TPA: hypothetical protein VNZ54_01915, partial [bacterium]|nr:hypothetical protein [bacterium]
ALLPWVFWAAHKALKEGSWFAWGLCGLAMGLQLLAVAAQLFAYTLAALLWFLAAEARAEAPVGGRWRALQPVALGLAAALGLAFLIAAPQLWPTLQYLPFCERNGYSHAQFVDGSISLRECLAWVVPGYFGWQEPTYDGPMSVRFTTEYLGLLPLALAAAALAGLWARERRVRWLAWLSLAALFLAQREWTPFEWAIQHLPVLRGFRFWSRILFLDTFAVCALAAYGWDQMRDGPGRRRAWAGALAFVGLAVALATAAWALAAHRVGADRSVLHGMLAGTQPRFTAETIGMAQDSARATLWLLPPLLGVLWAATRRWPRGLALALALALMAKDQGQVARRFIRFGEPEPPALQGRMAGPAPAPAGLEPYRVADAEGLACNRLMVMGYESLVGFSSMKMDSFLRINQAMQNRPQEWMDLYNVRYRVLPSGPDPSVMRFEGNPHAYPRAWLVSRSQAVSGDAEAYARLADPAFDPRSDVLLAQDLGLPGGRPQGTVTWLARSPAGESLDVATDRAAVLVLSNAWYPSWRCRVDGVDRPVLKADGGLQAVALGAGRHRLDFRFDPGLYQAALAASLAGLLLLLLLGLGLWRPRLAPADGARP